MIFIATSKSVRVKMCITFLYVEILGYKPLITTCLIKRIVHLYNWGLSEQTSNKRMIRISERKR